MAAGRQEFRRARLIPAGAKKALQGIPGPVKAGSKAQRGAGNGRNEKQL